MPLVSQPSFTGPGLPGLLPVCHPFLRRPSNQAPFEDLLARGERPRGLALTLFLSHSCPTQSGTSAR